MADDGHEDHGVFTLSITESASDGSHTHQSWDLCGCMLPGLRSNLGPPDFENTASAEAVKTIAAAVASTPGNVYRERGE